MSKYEKPSRIPFPTTKNNNGKPYAGIGSRSITKDKNHDELKEVMISCGYYLALMGFTLRSGGADGPDEYFELGTDLAMYVKSKGEKEIFLPWWKFRENPSHLFGTNIKPNVMKEMIRVAAEYHPGWYNERFKKENVNGKIKINKNEIDENYKIEETYQELKDTYKKMMSRNVCQIKGENLDNPVKFVICWTADGVIDKEHRTKDTGGTGQAIAIASDLGINVYNLQREDHLLRIKEGIKEWEQKFGPRPDISILPYEYNQQKKFSM